MDEALLREIKQKALYRACMFFVSDFDEKFTADQIIEAIWNESGSVILWEAVEHMDSEDIVEMIDGLANDFVEFAIEYNQKNKTKESRP
jgi:broad-specificity NMP kinase